MRTKKFSSKNIGSNVLRIGLSLFFMAYVVWWSYTSFDNISNHLFLSIAALFGAYMAMNIGANDVANNVGPAVGSGAMSMSFAIVIAVIFEASGALIAGGDVVSTIKKDIIDPAMFINTDQFIWAMTAALFAGALWLNLATAIGAPVSTTHSIVGGVMGGGIAAAGFSIVAWGTMGKIAASWIISPLLGGVIAAGFLYFIKKKIVYKKDKIKSAKKIVPILNKATAMLIASFQENSMLVISESIAGTPILPLVPPVLWSIPVVNGIRASSTLSINSVSASGFQGSIGGVKFTVLSFPLESIPPYLATFEIRT